MIGAAKPSEAYVGMKPTSTVDTPMTTIVTRKVYFRPDEVTDPTEDQRSERPDQEAGGIGAERAQQRGRLVARREEQPREERCEDRVQIEVVPLEDRADRRRNDDAAFFGRAHDALAGHHSCGYTHRLPLVEDRARAGRIWIDCQS